MNWENSKAITPLTELPGYMIEPLTIDELRGFVDDLKRRMVLMAYPDTDGART